ncbi:hypothetical protein CSPHI_07590 [Corynebacterium sphenisci DSM 44792]|uniref:Uncharacterized protein n=1 Tax=Corynebacterium sphenisci DSM 44792 TaxID=1437874 RepID=A0A1L7CYL8_9CORY|nr:hypothetical protein [Corynebacterium sphenisci]APT90922.1 hypothetical protein CSPHI_07590 [Corynebacterium sphenisci DSM 44792]
MQQLEPKITVRLTWFWVLVAAVAAVLVSPGFWVSAGLGAVGALAGEALLPKRPAMARIIAFIALVALLATAILQIVLGQTGILG